MTGSAHNHNHNQEGILSEPLLRPDDAAKLLSVKPSWIYEATRTGRLPHLKIGRHLRYLRTDLEDWVKDQREPRRNA